MSVDVIITFETDQTLENVVTLLRKVGLKIRKTKGGKEMREHYNYEGRLSGVHFYLSPYKQRINLEFTTYAGFHFGYQSFSIAHAFFEEYIAEILSRYLQTKVEVFYGPIMDPEQKPEVTYKPNPEWTGELPAKKMGVLYPTLRVSKQTNQRDESNKNRRR